MRPILFVVPSALALWPLAAAVAAGCSDSTPNPVAGVDAGDQSDDSSIGPRTDGAADTSIGPSADAPFDSAPPVATKVQVYQTSRNAGAAGAPDHLADKGTIDISSDAPADGATTITVDLGNQKQSVLGFGAALTEATASVVTGLPADKQKELMDAYFSDSGSQYTLARTHIGSCDFALTQYSYDDSTTPDPTLSKFSIDHDKTLLIPFLKKATDATGGKLQILASPWSAPGWMKDNGKMQGSGSDGSLLKTYYAAYAKYFSKYLQAYRDNGVTIWGVTTQNEAAGVGGSREGMQWAPADMNTFIRDNLGPTLEADGVSDTKVFYFDHNKGDANSLLMQWANVVLKDQNTAKYITGTAVHWYDNTVQTFDDTLDAVHALNPDKAIIFDEGTADALGDTQYGQASPAYKYTWLKDDYWWIKDDYDWGWFFASKADHPIYQPLYRYIRDIINGLNHWYVGFIDWNAVLNIDGGPGHIVNPVPAAIFVDPAKSAITYTPAFYALQHFSKFLRPQARIADTKVTLASSVTATDYDDKPTMDGKALIATAAKNEDGSIAIVVFNETKNPIDYTLVVGAQTVKTTIPAQALQTLVWK